MARKKKTTPAPKETEDYIGDNEPSERVTELARLMNLHKVESVLIEYAGSGDSGEITHSEVIPESIPSNVQLELIDIADELVFNLVQPNFNDSGSSGEMKFWIDDDEKLKMTGEHRDFYETSDNTPWDHDLIDLKSTI